MNAERRIQKLRVAIPPRLRVKTDWEVVRDVAVKMGKTALFSFANAEEIWNEIRNVWPAVYGITYERLDKNGIQWPCPALDHPGTEVLHTDSFPTEGKKAKLSAIEFLPTSEQVSVNFPFILITGRSLYHFNAGTMTYRTPEKLIQSSDFLYVNPADADALKLENGDRVTVSSKYGEASLPICIGDSVKKGELFSTFHDNQVFINNLTSSVRDTYVNTPEYKVTAVRIEKIRIN